MLLFSARHHLDTAAPLPINALPKIYVKAGTGSRRKGKLCIMQIVSWLAGEGNSLYPQTCSNVIAAKMIQVNDNAQCKERQRLKQIAPLLVDFHLSTAAEQKAAMRIQDVETAIMVIRDLRFAMACAHMMHPAALAERELVHR